MSKAARSFLNAIALLLLVTTFGWAGPYEDFKVGTSFRRHVADDQEVLAHEAGFMPVPRFDPRTLPGLQNRPKSGRLASTNQALYKTRAGSHLQSAGGLSDLSMQRGPPPCTSE